MQNGYNETDLETGTLKVTFFDVTNYEIPKNVNWDEVSILDMKLAGDHIRFELINDMTDDYLEININADHVSTMVVSTLNDSLT